MDSPPSTPHLPLPYCLSAPSLPPRPSPVAAFVPYVVFNQTFDLDNLCGGGVRDQAVATGSALRLPVRSANLSESESTAAAS